MRAPRASRSVARAASRHAYRASPSTRGGCPQADGRRRQTRRGGAQVVDQDADPVVVKPRQRDVQPERRDAATARIEDRDGEGARLHEELAAVDRPAPPAGLLDDPRESPGP